jgi:hypothetical protein
MATVTFSTAVGGDGSTVTDDANPTTGLANGGHRARFVPALAQTVAVAQNTVTKATEAAASAAAAAASAASALVTPSTAATSPTTLVIGTGTKSLTLAQTGKTFVVGQYVALVALQDASLILSFVDNAYAVLDPNDAIAPNYMVGVVSAFNSGTGAMTVIVTHTGGGGAMAGWSVTAASPPELPSQSGNSGKILVTNGQVPSWQPNNGSDLVNQALGIV